MPKPKSKVPKRTLFVAMMLMFCLSFTPVHALTINAQPQTTCDKLGYCKTEVNMTPYLTIKEISDVKLSDYTKMIYATTYDKTMVAKPKEANTFNVSYAANSIIISGYILPGTSNYWTFNLTKGVIIDPWWNYTTYVYNCSAQICYPMNENTGTTLNDRGDSNPLGLEGNNVWTTGFYDYGLNTTAGGGKMNSLVSNSYFTLMFWLKTTQTTAGSVITNNNATGAGWGIWYGRVGRAGKFSFYPSSSVGWQALGTTAMNDGAWRHIAIKWNSTNKVYIYLNGTYDGQLAISSLGVNDQPPSLFYDRNSNDNRINGFVDEFKYFNTSLTDAQVITEMNTPIYQTTLNSKYYDLSLWINGGVGNITTTCGGSNNNYTALTNLTGLNISLLYNGTIANTSNTLVSWYSSLNSGVWNITANASNSSTNASTMLWHTINKANPVLSLNLSNSTPCTNQNITINCTSNNLNYSDLKIYNSTNELTNGGNYIITTADIQNIICNSTITACYNAGSTSENIYGQSCEAEQPPANITYGNLSNNGCCPISTFFCVDNDTLVQKWFVNNQTTLAYQYCFYGCDNKTMVCAPVKYQQDIIIILIVVFSIIIIVGVYRWVR